MVRFWWPWPFLKSHSSRKTENSESFFFFFFSMLPQWGAYNEYPQHIFLQGPFQMITNNIRFHAEIRKNTFQIALLIWSSDQPFICIVWLESSFSAWRKLRSMAAQSNLSKACPDCTDWLAGLSLHWEGTCKSSQVAVHKIWDCIQIMSLR